MSRTLPVAKVKICGIKSLDTAKAIRALPIDYVGFVFANSKRKVTAQEAKELITTIIVDVENPPKSVGVFVNPTMEELQNIMEVVQLDIIQLHGQESAEFCKKVKLQWAVGLIKAISIHSQNSTSQNTNQRAIIEASLMPYQSSVDVFLLDTYDPVYGGGSGKAFQWDIIPAYEEVARSIDIPLLVAGGLHDGNIGELIDTYHPYGVDVSSGVETDGVKDVNKIMTFVERVKQ